MRVLIFPKETLSSKHLTGLFRDSGRGDFSGHRGTSRTATRIKRRSAARQAGLSGLRTKLPTAPAKRLRRIPGDHGSSPEGPRRGPPPPARRGERPARRSGGRGHCGGQSSDEAGQGPANLPVPQEEEGRQRRSRPGWHRHGEAAGEARVRREGRKEGRGEAPAAGSEPAAGREREGGTPAPSASTLPSSPWSRGPGRCPWSPVGSGSGSSKMEAAAAAPDAVVYCCQRRFRPPDARARHCRPGAGTRRHSVGPGVVGDRGSLRLRPNNRRITE